MSHNWEIMDPTNADDNPAKLNARVARYQQEFYRKLTPREKM